MNSRVDLKKVFIKNVEISNKSQLVLISLGIHTMDDLYLMYLLDIIPIVVTNVSLFPLVNANVQYTNEVNNDVKALLKVYCGVEELDGVGV